MKQTLSILVGLFLAFLIGGYFYRQADTAAVTRAEILAVPYSEDDSVTVSFSPSGFLNRDIQVIAYDFGERDQTIEDQLTDQILHDSLGRVLYREGFRHVVISSNGHSRIVLIETQKQFSKLPYSHALLSSTTNG